MQQIPSQTLELILELRKENGLEVSAAALEKDLKKARWSLEQAPRYRRAGRSPIFISGKFLSSNGRDPVTGEPEDPAASPAPSAVLPVRTKGKIDELALYKLLHEQGFPVKYTVNSLTGATEKQLPLPLAQIGMQFSAIPASATGVHVTQTTPQIQVAMPLEDFLKFAAITPLS